jgi:hypothetical protein
MQGSFIVVYLKLAHDLFGEPHKQLANLPSEMSVRNYGIESTASVGDRPESITPEI